MTAAAVLIALVLVWVVSCVPAYVIGKRRNVSSPGVAFVPLVGPTIVMLWSMDRSGWMCLLAVVPLVNIVWSIWFAIAMPRYHGRTGWWAVAFFLLPIVGYYLYAFTLEPVETTAAPAMS